MTDAQVSSGAPTDLPEDLRRVVWAMALLWGYRPRTAVQQVLGHLGLRRSSGSAFTPVAVGDALRALEEKGLVEDLPQRPGVYALAATIRGPAYAELLDALPTDLLRAALHRLESDYPDDGRGWLVYDAGATAAVLRLELLSGTSPKIIDRMKFLVGRALDWPALRFAAVLPGFDPVLFSRVDPALRWEIANDALLGLRVNWRPDLRPLCEWAAREADATPDRVAKPSRIALAELMLLRGDTARLERYLEGLDGAQPAAVRAAGLVHAGHWDDARLAFESAIRQARAETGLRKGGLPESIAWLFPLALLALPTPKHLELARKFCAGEAGARKSRPGFGWGRWVHVIGVRAGDLRLDRRAFDADTEALGRPGLDLLWKLLLAAWLGAETIRPAVGADFPDQCLREGEALQHRLEACGLAWLSDQVAAALQVLGGTKPGTVFFAGESREAWRDVLAALEALGADGSADPVAAGDERLVWMIELDADGCPDCVIPLRQKHGPRGWGKAQPVGIASLPGNDRLPAWDARVVRAIRVDRAAGRRPSIDRAAAVVALVGHPAVVFADVPGQFVELVEGTPEIEVIRHADRFVMRVTPALRDERRRGFIDLADEREAEALANLTVVRDSPQRARVIRFTAAQRRAAQLVSGPFAVPVSAQSELQSAVQALASHFQVHADQGAAAREVATESRLRAELAPSGNELILRLVAAPLGPEGPRVAPGRGRARLIAAVGGESVGTHRDLDRETRHVDAVLEALPFLDNPAESEAGIEWVVADPENALGVVEVLPGISAIAGIDWPKGRSARVVTVDAPQLVLSVNTDRDWFQLGGRAIVDDRLVMDFKTLVAAAQSRSRFVPMGEGVYAALTRSLRQRLAEVAAIAEPDREGGLRVPRVAAAWLDETLEGTAFETDNGFRNAIARLRAAANQVPAVPGLLQAQLRPYQEDGFRWAMGLAHAGFGACLADDMGLGKTLQALAVLLARGPGGAALVVAPTSVCGNWIAEARRFAPSLNVLDYGEGEREALVKEAGPMDVVVASYNLVLQGQARFAGRAWHTVIADEAQAIKNAAAKRSAAMFDVPAGFRLALSGTPVENRLTELWSIMRFVNPGLLGSVTRFNDRFAIPIERNHDRDAQQILRRLIGPFVLRRTKAQVLQDLPPRTELLLTITPGAAEAAHYEAIRREALAEVAQVATASPPNQTRFNVLAQLTRLRRAACDPRLATESVGLVGAKVQAFARLAAELVANGHKVLVFSQFVDFLGLLRSALSQNGIGCQYLDGATPAAERTRRVAAFQAGDGDLFLISLKAGGFGLNLTAADYVVITDPWWNPAAEDQAMGRAHRIGQSRPVTVYRLVTSGTVEERIVQLHTEKRALADSILAEGEASALPSTDDLIGLIRGS
ncbi:MAG: DEAD/DEAH box helicase [Betaproteobacteria bacterium]